MSFLSLCADSSRPPGLPNHNTISHGTFKTTGSHSRDKRQRYTAPPPHRRLIYVATNHHEPSNNAYPPSNPPSFSLSHLHVISMLTSHFSWFPIHFITSSWPRFFFFLLMRIILLVIPLPDLDDTDNHQQHEFDNNWTYETCKHHPW